MQELCVRRAGKDDLLGLLELYTYLHDEPFPVIDTRIENIWARITNDANHYILLGHVGEVLASSCVAVIVENLTRQQRPYAVIENVITHPDYRKKGYASLLLSAAKDIAVNHNCYKMMLMTGSKRESTLNFYRQAGYNSDDKTAFIQRL